MQMRAVWVVSGLFLAPSLGASPKYGPSGAPHAQPLAADFRFFQDAKNPAPDYWALSGYYVPQFNGAACSVASVTMALNGARARLPKDAETKIILQEALLKQLGGEWQKRVAPRFGLSSRRGVTLDLLARFAAEAFQKNGFERAQAELVRLDPRSPSALERLRADLLANEKSGDDFVLVNFDQKFFTDDTSVGHIAPVAAYDEKTHRVLVMEPDREWYEPYWVSDQRLLEAMSTTDSETGLSRGYVKIKLGLNSSSSK